MTGMTLSSFYARSMIMVCVVVVHSIALQPFIICALVFFMCNGRIHPYISATEVWQVTFVHWELKNVTQSDSSKLHPC